MAGREFFWLAVGINYDKKVRIIKLETASWDPLETMLVARKHAVIGSS